MRTLFSIIVIFGFLGCSEYKKSHRFTEVVVETIFNDSISIRALEVMDGSVAFAANNGIFGAIDLRTHQIRTNQQVLDSITPEFRAIAHTKTDFFMLSAGRPALLYKTGDTGQMELVYKEDSQGVFYDSMRFWNDKEGIAIGDEMQGCLSILITRDGGQTWTKVRCEDLPPAIAEEGAFAASNTNIAIAGNKTWIGTTESRVFYSRDTGRTWEIITTPFINTKPTEGIYSLDFFDDTLGVMVGGDYTNPEGKNANKAITKDGGKTWQLIAEGKNPGYKSCVQFVPNAGGKDLVSVGFTGISYSEDMGNSWTELSTESFYTIRFSNDSTAYAAGKNRIARLSFK